MTQMNDEYNLDTNAANSDLSRAGAGGGGSRGDKRIFKAKPTKDGQTYVNKLFLALVRPRDIAGLERYPSDHKLFYIKLFGHYVQRGDNPKEQDFVLCKVQHNKQAQELSKDSKYLMFEENRCALCEEARIAWDQYTARWGELGYPDKDSRTKLSKEEYKQVSSDPQLAALKDAAMRYQFKTRYALPTYNLEQQPLETGYQWFFASETVFKGLMELVRVGVRFYSLNPHPAVAGAIEGSEIFVTRDNTNGARFCEYSVQDNRQPLQLAEEEMTYLRNQGNLPPLLDLVEIWDYNRQKETLMAGVASDAGEVPAEAPRAAPRQAAAPAARPAPQAAARPAPQAVVRPASPRPAAAPVPSGATVVPPAQEVRHAAPPEILPPEGAGAPPPAARPAQAGQAPRPRRTW